MAATPRHTPVPEAINASGHTDDGSISSKTGDHHSVHIEDVDNNIKFGSYGGQTRVPELQEALQMETTIPFADPKDENGLERPNTQTSMAPTSTWTSLGPIYRHRRILTHILLFSLFTGWWIASLILHRNDKNWLIPFLLWLCITLRLIFFYVPIRHVSNAIAWAWNQTMVRVYDAIPDRYHSIAGMSLTIAVVVVGSMVPEENGENTRANRAVSLFGLITIFGCFYISSNNRAHVQWRTISGGILSQYIIGLFVLRSTVGYDIFRFIADRVADLFGFSKQGLIFLTSPTTADLGWFVLTVIPAIIFFISLVQVLFYVGFIQWFVGKLAAFVNWGLGVSGAEAIVAAATPFIGQGESVMLVRPFITYMTKAEIHQVMTCGFATISGAVLIGYIQLGLNAEVLVSSCVMSIPASIAISKLRYPETEETLTKSSSSVPDDPEDTAQNWLHAFAKGQWLGIKVGGTIIASLICVLGFVALINGLLTWWGHYLNINDPTLTLQTILGYALYPVAFLLGVPRNGDLLKVSRLIAEKIITNEYKAFQQLAAEASTMDQRSQLIATYALCGFGNVGSLGIQIGVLSQLAPARSGDAAKLATSALISGIASTLTSANIAGLIINGEIKNFL